MTSAITPSSINAQYPVAGQDNPSQGFRDNFAAISSNFAHAASEISALQTVAITTADLSTQTTPVVNNLLGSTLSNGLYQLFSGTFYSATSVSGSIGIDLSQGAVQQFIMAGNTTFNFATTGSTTGWPNYTGVSGVYSNAIILLQGNTLGVWTPTFTTTGGTVSYDANFPLIPGTSQQGISVGGESLTSIAVGSNGSGYVSPVTIGFSGGTPITNNTVPTATATYTIVGAGVSNVVYNSTTSANTTITTTATAGTGTIQGTVTLTFAAQLYAPYPTGSYIIVSGVTPSTYNGVFQVTNCTTTTVQYLGIGSGNMTQAGTITAGTAGNGFAVGDIVVMNSNPDVQLVVQTLACNFTGTLTATSNQITNVTNFTNLVAGNSSTGTYVTAASGQIPPSTYITQINTSLGTVTLSNPVTGTGTTNTLMTYVSTTGPVGAFYTTGGYLPSGTLTTPAVGVHNFTAITGSGTGLRCVVSCGVGAIKVTNPGDGYTTTAPTVAITGSTGYGATATAYITSSTAGKIQAIEAWTVNGGRNVYLRYLGQY